MRGAVRPDVLRWIYRGGDLDAFADVLRTRGVCEWGAPIAVARAPGRLEVIGGIADDSGSLVLQRPIAEAAWAAIQPTDRAAFDLVSVGRHPLTISLDTLAPDGMPIGYAEARRTFAGDERWAAYVAGVLLVLVSAKVNSSPTSSTCRTAGGCSTSAAGRARTRWRRRGGGRTFVVWNGYLTEAGDPRGSR